MQFDPTQTTEIGVICRAMEARFPHEYFTDHHISHQRRDDGGFDMVARCHVFKIYASALPNSTKNSRITIAVAPMNDYDGLLAQIESLPI